MSRYLEILAVSEPAAVDVDDNQRVLFSCNFEVVAAGPISSFLEEMAALLSSAGLATLTGVSMNLFYGPAADIPDGSGPYITLIGSGGSGPRETHNGSKYERPSFQVIVRGLPYTTAEGRAWAIFRELDGKRDVTVTA